MFIPFHGRKSVKIIAILIDVFNLGNCNALKSRRSFKCGFCMNIGHVSVYMLKKIEYKAPFSS